MEGTREYVFTSLSGQLRDRENIKEVSLEKDVKHLKPSKKSSENGNIQLCKVEAV